SKFALAKPPNPHNLYPKIPLDTSNMNQNDSDPEGRNRSGSASLPGEFPGDPGLGPATPGVVTPARRVDLRDPRGTTIARKKRVTLSTSTLDSPAGRFTLKPVEWTGEQDSSKNSKTFLGDRSGGRARSSSLGAISDIGFDRTPTRSDQSDVVQALELVREAQESVANLQAEVVRLRRELIDNKKKDLLGDINRKLERKPANPVMESINKGKVVDPEEWGGIQLSDGEMSVSEQSKRLDEAQRNTQRKRASTSRKVTVEDVEDIDETITREKNEGQKSRPATERTKVKSVSKPDVQDVEDLEESEVKEEPREKYIEDKAADGESDAPISKRQLKRLMKRLKLMSKNEPKGSKRRNF
ncbi:hypothetical protein H0H93_013179, partial [Arthromyces matolae]